MADIYSAQPGPNPEMPGQKETVIPPPTSTGEASPEQKMDEQIAKERIVAKETVTMVLRRMGEYKRTELFGAYAIRPGRKVMNEQADEETVLMLRAHPITNVGWILLSVILLTVPQALTMTGVFDQFPEKYVFIGKLAWYLFTLGFSFERFLDWFYSVLVITNERLIDIDFVNLLFRDMQYANLNHIEQPSMISGGFIRSLFRYGDVTIATAADAAAPTIEGRAIPYPEKVIRLISELSEELEKRREIGK